MVNFIPFVFFSSAPAAFEESVRVCVDCKEKLDNLATHQPASVSWTLILHAIQFCPCVSCCSCVSHVLECWNLSSVYILYWGNRIYSNALCMQGWGSDGRLGQRRKAGAATEGWGSDGRLGEATEGWGSDRKLVKAGQAHRNERYMQCSYLLTLVALYLWRLLYNDLRTRLHPCS